MRRSAQSIMLLGSTCLLLVANRASAEPMGDICAAPKLQTDKWHSISEAGGLTVLLPPGYAARGSRPVSDRGSSALGFASAQATTNDADHNSPDSHFYYQGQHRIIGVGSGAGPSMFNTSGGQMNQMGDCETTIAGRRVEISLYNWSVEDNAMAPSGDAGTHYRAWRASSLRGLSARSTSQYSRTSSLTSCPAVRFSGRRTLAARRRR